MAKLPDVKYMEKGKTGETIAFTSSVIVTAEGRFYMSIPQELSKAANTLEFPKETHRGKLRIYGDSLNQCKRMVKETIAEHLSCTTERSLVILYEFISTCNFVKNSEGEIFTNGNYCPNDYTWMNHEERYGKGNDDFLLGFRAQVFRRLKHSRPASEQIEYEDVSSDPEDEQLGEWGKKLNEFCVGKLQDHGQEMPYTEEMAKRFYEMMMRLCALSDKLSEIFSDPETLQLSMSNVLMLQKG
jgi:hypothetical protein